MPISGDLLEQIGRLIRPLKMRIANTVARAIVTLVDDSTRLRLLQMAALQLTADSKNREIIEDGEHFQEYGFFSIPQPGAEAVVIFPNGDRGHPLVIAVADRRSRPTGGQGGEAGLYTDEGDEVRLARGHVIVLKTSGEIRAGSAAAATPVALASELQALKSAIAGWSPIGGDGGASLKLIVAAWGGTGPGTPAGSTKLKTE